MSVMETGVTVAEMNGLLELLGSVFTFIIGKVSDVVDLVMANPLLLIPIGVVLLYTIIATFKRLF